MTFFESLLILLLAAVLLLQVARRARLPYPAMLALAGVAVAFIPGGPSIRIDPQTALALFIAPVLLDAAYDFPLSAAGKLWRPLVMLAVGAVLATAATVAFVGWWAAGLPPAAALVLGAIVAPPDAAAAVAVLGQVSLPRRTIGVLKGESLFNDATALLLFNGALASTMAGGLDRQASFALGVAVPGGLVLGIALGFLFGWVGRFVGNTLGGNILQFLNALLVWVIADHLHLSAVLASVACAITIARATQGAGSPRMRVHSLAVWASVVFLLNVVAFLLMGMQARLIIETMSGDRLRQVGWIVGLVIVVVVATRFVVVMLWGWLARRYAAVRGDLPAPVPAQGVVVAWSGMRGLVTLATAFALPDAFPQRDLVVLSAFGVVLATLVIQGLTLAPLIRRLGLDRVENPGRDLAEARRVMAQIALDCIEAQGSGSDLTMTQLFRFKAERSADRAMSDTLGAYRQTGLAVVQAQRRFLERLRKEQNLDMDGFYLLQEEIDWRELTLLPEDQRRIEEA